MSKTHSALREKLEQELPKRYSQTPKEKICYILDQFEEFGIVDTWQLHKKDKKLSIDATIDNHDTFITYDLQNNILKFEYSEFCDSKHDEYVWQFIKKEFKNYYEQHHRDHEEYKQKDKHTIKDNMRDNILSHDTLIGILNNGQDVPPKLYNMIYHMFNYIKYNNPDQDQDQQLIDKIKQVQSISHLLVQLEMDDMHPDNYAVVYCLFGMIKEVSD